MSDTELNKLLFSAYLLGQRVFQRANDIRLKAIDDKSFDLLHEVAEGKTTLTVDRVASGSREFHER